MKRAKLVVVGSTNLDMVVQATRIPRPGETGLGGRFTMVPGGKGANQAVAAARMGGEVTFIARVGQGAFGRQALEGFQKDGISTDYITEEREEQHGVALILVDQNGENAIAVAPGANSRLAPDDVYRAEAAFADADIVLLQLEVPLAAVQAAVDLAEKHSKRIILNPAPSQPLSERILSRVSIFTPNESEAEMLLGGGDAGLGGIAVTAEHLLGKGVGAVIVTLGREGVFVVTPQGQYRVPGRRVKTVDTTAAGDAFSGARAVAIGEGRELRDAVPMAVAASALSVTRVGAQSSLPSRAEVEALLSGRSSS